MSKDSEEREHPIIRLAKNQPDDYGRCTQFWQPDGAIGLYESDAWLTIRLESQHDGIAAWINLDREGLEIMHETCARILAADDKRQQEKRSK